MQEGNKVFSQIDQDKKESNNNKILQDNRILLETDDEKGKEYVTSEKHCEKICEECEGEGTVCTAAYQQAGEIVEGEETECSLCKGTGRV